MKNHISYFLNMFSKFLFSHMFILWIATNQFKLKHHTLTKYYILSQGPEQV
jgi:hypothetical protein